MLITNNADFGSKLQKLASEVQTIEDRIKEVKELLGEENGISPTNIEINFFDDHKYLSSLLIDLYEELFEVNPFIDAVKKIIQLELAKLNAELDNTLNKIKDLLK